MKHLLSTALRVLIALFIKECTTTELLEILKLLQQWQEKNATAKSLTKKAEEK